MKNIVGQVPRGDDFFPRGKIVNLIYRRLNSGANVYMAAPRRVGKTAIMRHLEDNPRENCEFQYIITESNSERNRFCLNKTLILVWLKFTANVVGLASVSVGKKI
jgi:AAA+ ATPase superfamily predicted ATPase